MYNAGSKCCKENHLTRMSDFGNERRLHREGGISMWQEHRISRNVLVVAVIGCCVATAQEVMGNFVLGTDFSKYHTYKWVSIEGCSHPNEFFR